MGYKNRGFILSERNAYYYYRRERCLKGENNLYIYIYIDSMLLPLSVGTLNDLLNGEKNFSCYGFVCTLLSEQIHSTRRQTYTRLVYIVIYWLRSRNFEGKY